MMEGRTAREQVSRILTLTTAWSNEKEDWFPMEPTMHSTSGLPITGSLQTGAAACSAWHLTLHGQAQGENLAEWIKQVLHRK